jgi:hypothetical protein
VLVSVFSLRRIWIEPVPGHYRLFARTTQALWSGQHAFGTDHGTGVGFWFYSPSCALFFFGPFSLMSEKTGMLLYTVVSLLLFGWGAHWMAKEILGKNGRATQMFYALCAAPMLSSIVTTKLEIAITGILMASAAALIRGQEKGMVWAGVGAAFVLNWKFQPGPTILLWFLVLWQAKKFREFVLGLGVGSILAWGLPYLFLPASYLAREQAIWFSSLEEFSRTSNLNFENVFTFARFAFGVRTPWVVAQIIAVSTGIGFAIYMWSWIGRARGLKAREFLSQGILLASALGATFTMAFSPLGQNNALILIAPLLLWFSRLAFSEMTCPREQVAYLGAIALALIVPYSDLIPLDTREWLHALSIKQMLLLVAVGLGLVIEFRREFPGAARTRRSRRG